MTRLSAAVGALLLAAAARPCPAYESRLDPVRDAVAERAVDLDVGAPPRTAEKRAILAVLRRLSRGADSLLDDLATASAVARRLDRAFPGDPDFAAAQVVAFADLRAGIDTEIDALRAWEGKLGTPEREARLARRIAAAERWLEWGDLVGEVRYLQAKYWYRSCREVRRARRLLGLDRPERPPFRGVAPDFELLDANDASPSGGTAVSPRDHLGSITAWYFTLTT